MKATGIVRKIDELGRVVILIELKRTLDIEVKDSLEIFVDDKNIILKKCDPACIFYGQAKDISIFRGKNLCPFCMAEVNSTYNKQV